MRTSVVAKSIAATAILLLLGGTGYCQRGGISGENANTDAAAAAAAASRAAQQQREQKELDAQYKAALGRTKVPAAKTDPWGTVRPASAGAAKAQ